MVSKILKIVSKVCQKYFIKLGSHLLLERWTHQFVRGHEECVSHILMLQQEHMRIREDKSHVIWIFKARSEWKSKNYKTNTCLWSVWIKGQMVYIASPTSGAMVATLAHFLTTRLLFLYLCNVMYMIIWSRLFLHSCSMNDSNPWIFFRVLRYRCPGQFLLLFSFFLFIFFLISLSFYETWKFHVRHSFLNCRNICHAVSPWMPWAHSQPPLDEMEYLFVS